MLKTETSNLNASQKYENGLCAKICLYEALIPRRRSCPEVFSVKVAALDYDFKSYAKGIAVPHGICDLAKNICYLTVGTNKDTAEFVRNNIEYHRNHSIKSDYPKAKKMSGQLH